MNREERERQIAKDDGAPDETVYVSSRRATPHVAPNEVRYHETPGCSLPSHREAISLPRHEAQEQTMAPCRECVLEDVDKESRHESQWQSVRNNTLRQLGIDPDEDRQATDTERSQKPLEELVGADR